ncbi:MAG: hypothetical protein ACPG5L_07490 [Vibrio gallaecicus]
MVKELFSDFPIWKFIFAVTGLCVALLTVVVIELYREDNRLKGFTNGINTRLSLVEDSRCDANLCSSLSSSIAINTEKVNFCSNQIKTIQGGSYRAAVEARLSKSEERLRVVEKEVAVLIYRKENER